MTDVDPDGRRGCVLVVDDADDLRQLVAMILRSNGYDVVEAASARDALAVQSAREVDTMLVDLQLGAASGLDLVAAVRSTPKGAHSRVVLMTATPEIPRRTLEALHVERVLRKPVSIDDLVSAVRDPRAG